MLAFWSPKGGSWSRRSMRRPWKLGTRNATLLALRDRMRCFAKKVFARIAPYRFISHTKMSIVFRKDRSRIILLESQPGKQSSRSKRSREMTTESITVWVQSTKTLGKNRQSMTVCGYCCYYLEHCSKTNHIAIKRAKYENVFGLVAH